MTPRLLLLAVPLALSGCAMTTTLASAPAGPAGPSSGAGPTDLDVCLVHKGTEVEARLAFEEFRGNPAPFFRTVSRAQSVQDARRCDLAVVLENMGWTIFSPTNGEAFSAYTGESLLRVSAKGDFQARKVGRMLFDAFRKGTPLHEKLLAQRPASGAAPAARTAAAPVPAPSLPAALAPSFRLPQRPDDFAVVVGVEEYSDLPRADFAERDSAAVTAHLEALGVPRRNIKSVAGPKASLSSLTKNLEDWLPRNVKPSSRVYFYFSGHGAPDPATGKAYLVPWDGDANYLAKTAYPVERLYAGLGALGAKETVVILDACFSGSGGRSVLAKGARPLVTTVEAVPERAGDLSVLAAARGDQITATLESAGHGLFTYFLLKGLGGAARGPDGRVTLKGLHGYLSPNVQDEASRQGREQEPTLRAGSDLLLRD